jgi:delta(3,5)-delta(2,4)-dienoyl-CoA isomerase
MRVGFVYSYTLSLCSCVFPDKQAMMAGALEMAGEIAGRSPVAVQGTKVNLIYSRDHSVAEGLNYMVRLNYYKDAHNTTHISVATTQANKDTNPYNHGSLKQVWFSDKVGG